MMELRKQRAAMYRFLSRVYILEVDEELLGAMKKLSFPAETGENGLAGGYAMLKQALDRGESIEDLAVDYARIFLAAGVATGLAAFPYESIYVSKKQLMNQSAASECEKYYAAKGLKAREDMYRIPNDHIGLQCEYMAVLCESAESDEDTAEQKAFFEAHMKRWIPLFCADVRKYAGTDFYRAIEMITREFIEQERDFLS